MDVHWSQNLDEHATNQVEVNKSYVSIGGYDRRQPKYQLSTLSTRGEKTMCYHPMHHLDVIVHFWACQCLELIFMFFFMKFQPNI